MAASDGVITSVGSFGWWGGYFNFQNGGKVLYLKNQFNFTRLNEMGEGVNEEDYIPPQWIGITAPFLHRQSNVENLMGDVLSL